MKSKAKTAKSVTVLFIFFLLSTTLAKGAIGVDERYLAAFSDPASIWDGWAEQVIEEAFRLHFQTRIIDGRIMNIRMPFAMENERNILTEEDWGFYRRGKGSPEALWRRINELLDSDDFQAYVEVLSSGREKVIIFDMPSQSWSVSTDHFEIARMRAGPYRGLPHRPHVLVSGRGIQETDVYNYLYAVGLVGMDCSGFVWHILSHVAAAGGVDLGRQLSRVLGVRDGIDPAMFAGTSFFNSRNYQIVPVRDQIRNLRPADIILFRAEDGGMGHAAIIQSIDFSAGVIRYLQSTDEAPLAERGVHESFIYFDPRNTAISLSHPSLIWTKRRYAPFPGERPSAFSDDGLRFRAFPEHGGGRVVRLPVVTEVIERMSRR